MNRRPIKVLLRNIVILLSDVLRTLSLRNRSAHTALLVTKICQLIFLILLTSITYRSLILTVSIDLLIRRYLITLAWQLDGPMISRMVRSVSLHTQILTFRMIAIRR